MISKIVANIITLINTSNDSDITYNDITYNDTTNNDITIHPTDPIIDDPTYHDPTYHDPTNHTSDIEVLPGVLFHNPMTFTMLLVGLMCVCNGGVRYTLTNIHNMIMGDDVGRHPESRHRAIHRRFSQSETLQTYIIEHQEDSENPQGVKPDEPCSICFEDFSPRVMTIVLECNHRFHTHCIMEWLQQEQTCPLCRKVLDLQ